MFGVVTNILHEVVMGFFYFVLHGVALNITIRLTENVDSFDFFTLDDRQGIIEIKCNIRFGVALCNE